LIRLTSRGPALFVQERIGINRRPFQMFKFRTMYNRADEMQAEIEELNESGEGLFKIRHDPRVTPVGRLLRRFSLDELPQLFNVLKGNMNIVGPRPLPRRDFNNYYEKWHYNRHEGLPGLTCLWQVSGRSDVNFYNMCILDVYYLRNRSSVLDAKILLRTIGVVLFAKGAY
jgi:lipopolysaccharide/colanic/teichoic acid biosynthesis glycosyltransferase